MAKCSKHPPSGESMNRSASRVWVDEEEGRAEADIPPSPAAAPRRDCEITRPTGVSSKSERPTAPPGKGTPPKTPGRGKGKGRDPAPAPRPRPEVEGSGMVEVKGVPPAPSRPGGEGSSAISPTADVLATCGAEDWSQAERVGGWRCEKGMTTRERQAEDQGQS